MHIVALLVVLYGTENACIMYMYAHRTKTFIPMLESDGRNRETDIRTETESWTHGRCYIMVSGLRYICACFLGHLLQPARSRPMHVTARDACQGHRYRRCP